MNKVLLFLALLISASLFSTCSSGDTIGEEYDVVFRGGRVMDPETGLDAVRNVGIVAGSIATITEEPIEGKETIDVSGLVVAPGFIDLHSHGQDPISNRLAVADGVTTSLELEIGVYPVAEWLAEREGRSIIHYGATVGHLPARVKLFHDVDIGSWALEDPDDPNRAVLMRETDYAYKDTSAEEREMLEAILSKGLRRRRTRCRARNHLHAGCVARRDSRGLRAR